MLNDDLDDVGHLSTSLLGLPKPVRSISTPKRNMLANGKSSQVGWKKRRELHWIDGKNESNHSNFVQNLCWEKIHETPQGAVFLWRSSDEPACMLRQTLSSIRSTGVSFQDVGQASAGTRVISTWQFCWAQKRIGHFSVQRQLLDAYI